MSSDLPKKPVDAGRAAAERARQRALLNKSPSVQAPTFLPKTDAVPPAAPPRPAPPPRTEAPDKADAPPPEEPEVDPLAAVASGGDAALAAMRKAVEARSSAPDLGSFFVDGYFTQTVVVIPSRLTIILRTLTSRQEDEVEYGIAAELRRIADQKIPVTGAIQSRVLLKFSIASHVIQYNHERWPDSLEARLERVDALPAPLRNLLAVLIAWFEEDCTQALSVEAVKNG